jgi:hypothetical protein
MGHQNPGVVSWFTSNTPRSVPLVAFEETPAIFIRRMTVGRSDQLLRDHTIDIIAARRSPGGLAFGEPFT